MNQLLADAAIAVDLVREAGMLAASMQEGIETREKTSVSDVVTAADHAAERLVVDHLETFRPDDGIVGEEGSSRPGVSGRTWVIDPIDGTWNYAHQMPWWCTAVALLDDGEPVLGAVHHPAEDAVYVGGPGLPPTRNGEPLAELADRPLEQVGAATYLHPPWMGTEVAEAWERGAKGAAALRMTGSGTLDHMSVAMGRCGVLFQHTVPSWDWWPGAAILLGLGGAARRTTAAGREWSVAGLPTAVGQVIDALERG